MTKSELIEENKRLRNNQALNLKQAIEYLDRNDADIDSRANLFYRNALYIAAGLSDVDMLLSIKNNNSDKKK